MSGNRKQRHKNSVTQEERIVSVQAPSSKLQAPEKRQASSSKPLVRRIFRSLELGFFLVFGVWCLELFSSTGCVTKSDAKIQAQKAYIAGQQQALILSQQPRGPSVTIVGPVHNPVVPWVEGLTLANAIVAADYYDKSDPRSIVVNRQGRLIPVDPKALLTGQDVPLQPGDVVELKP
jgi:hypothetical protein